MGDLIIKPASSGSLKIQDQAGTNFITTGTSSGLTLGSGVTFPAGHIINMASYSTRATSSLSASWGGADFSATNIDNTVKNARSKMIINFINLE